MRVTRFPPPSVSWRESSGRISRGWRTPFADDSGRAEPFLVDVVQRDRAVGKLGKADVVAEQLLGEDRTTGGDERDLGDRQGRSRSVSGGDLIEDAARRAASKAASQW
jgi:hypothetical protein